MKKNLSRLATLVAAAVITSNLAILVSAGTTYYGAPTNVQQLNGTTVDTGSGNGTSGGTQRVFIATDQPALTNSQPMNLKQVNGSTISLGQAASASSLPVVLSSPMPSALGQTTMANSLPVVIPSDQSNLPANIKQISGSTLNLGQQSSANSLPVVLSSPMPSALGQTTMVNSLPVVLSSNHSNVPTNTVQLNGTTIDTGSGNGTTGGTQRVFLATDQPTLTNPLNINYQAALTVTKATASFTASYQFLAATATRKGLECWADKGNTDVVFCNWGASAATTDPITMGPGSSYQPPAGVVPQQAFSCIPASGTQVIRCQDYK